MPHLPFRLIGLALVASFGAHVQAAIFTVGSPSGPGQPCTHGTIQSAITAANNSPGADTIRLTRSLTYEPEANTINTAQELTIEGGYATCTSAADATNTVVSGTGGVAAPVFTINAQTGALIHLRRLTISGGDVAGEGKGGGIYFKGNGRLEIRDSLITQNTAGSGGGIYAEGTGASAALAIGNNVVVSNNIARYNGGGIVADGIEMTMLAPDSILLRNEALGTSSSGGYGGGMYLRSAGRASFASIGSGSPLFGAVYANSARYGGGVAVGGNADGDRAVLKVYATTAGTPARILANRASVAGGGLHVRSEDGIISGDMGAEAYLFNAALEDNTAPQGAALQVQGSDTIVLVEQPAIFSFNIGEWPADAIRCSSGSACGRIAGNRAVNAANQPTQGAVINAEHDAVLWLGSLGSGIVIDGNSGGRLISSSNSDDYNPVELRNTLIAGNQVSQELLRSTGGYGLYVFDSTVTGNTIGGARVFSATNKDVQLRRSILWQPGTPLLARSGGSLAVESLLASDLGSFSGATGSGVAPRMANPRFVDPEHSDYSLRAGSPAIDLAAALPGDDRDVLGLPRDVDLPIRVNFAGPRDLGAFERQSLQPMVLNGDFDAPDLRLWTEVLAGVTTRDATQNASGAPGSASAHIARTNAGSGQETHGLSQCIHLPGPARYALNGWGRVGGLLQPRDSARLHWEYRRNGGEDCAGAPEKFGWHHLSSGAWSRPAEPALIEVSQTDWGDSPSIKVTLVAVEAGVAVNNTTDAWFDGITLEAVSLDDVIFANGFEP